MQRALLGQPLAHVEFLARTSAELDAQIPTLTAPSQSEADRQRNPAGIDQRTAEVTIAELGVDVAVFPSDRYCASWAGLRPGNHESAGKRKSWKTRKGSHWLRAALVEVG